VQVPRPHPSTPRRAHAGRRTWCARARTALLLLTATLAPIAFAQGPAGERLEVAHGLIVRLKQAQPHYDVARKRALAAQETRRWDELLAQAGVAQRASLANPRRRSVGRDQVLLEFGRPLAAGEADVLADRLRQQPEVDWVAPNVREQRLQIDSSTPVDPMFAQQWWLHEAGGSDANAIADRRRGVPGFLAAWAAGIPGAEGREASVVAVLDTGITPHPELQGRLLPGRDFVSDDLFGNDGQPGRDDDPTDPGDWVDASELADPRLARCTATRSSWHGTAVAGVLAASSDNGSGVAGAIRRGQVLPVRVAGKCGATVADIIDGLRWAAGLEVDGQRNPHPARVVNLSFGGTRACGREYQDTINELRAHGVVVVAAAGNAHGSVTRPASCAGVVGVVALNRDGFKAHYSSFGQALAASGIATVGGDDAQGAWGALLADGGIVTLSNSGPTGHAAADFAAYHGTSFAAPMVAATLTLMLAVNPELSVEQLITGLRVSARPHLRSSLLAECSDTNPGRCACTTAACGAGRLDVKQALTYARSPADYTAPVWPEERVESPELAQAVTLGADRAPNVPSVDDEPGAGGGALGGGWLLLLATGVAALRRGGVDRAPPLRAAARTA
jgi:serine protease